MPHAGLHVPPVRSCISISLWSATQLWPAVLPTLSSVVVPSMVGAGVTKDGGAVLMNEGAGGDVLMSEGPDTRGVAVPSEKACEGVEGDGE